MPISQEHNLPSTSPPNNMSIVLSSGIIILFADMRVRPISNNESTSPNKSHLSGELLDSGERGSALAYSHRALAKGSC